MWIKNSLNYTWKLKWNNEIENDWIIEFYGNIDSLDKIDHIWRNKIMSTWLFSIRNYKIHMFSNDTHHKMAILDYGNHIKTYNVNNICANISFEYGKKNCNEFSQCKDWRMESFVLRWTNYVYGKDVTNIIHKKYLTMKIQIKVEDKI